MTPASVEHHLQGLGKLLRPWKQGALEAAAEVWSEGCTSSSSNQNAREFALCGKWVKGRALWLHMLRSMQVLEKPQQTCLHETITQTQPGAQLGTELTLSKYQDTGWFSNGSGSQHHLEDLLNSQKARPHLRVSNSRWMNHLVSDSLRENVLF